MEKKIIMVSSKFVLILLILILVIHILATVFYWYWTIDWLDIVMHFLGGFWLAAVFLRFLVPKLRISDHKSLIILILMVSFAVFVGVLWEFYEFLFDVFGSINGHLKFTQQGVADTMSDLFFDLLGGSVCFGIYRFFIHKK